MMKNVWAVAVRVPLIATVLCANFSLAAAQTVPLPWTAADIGSPTLAGSTTHASGVFTANAAGAGLGGGTWAGPTDQFHFISQRVTGDVDVIVRVDSLTSQGVWTEAGVMIRSSLAANSVHATAEVTSGRGVQYVRRLTTGGALNYTAGPAGTAPMWLRAVRAGTRVTTYSSTNGTDWTTLGSDSIPLGSTAYVGLSVTSHNPSARITARLSNVRVTATGLPAPQSSMDIGSPAIAGAASYAAGRYTIRAAGADIWDVSDQFHFVYQPVTGNAEVVARVASITRAHNWSKAGVMVRESLTGPSRHASVFVSAAQGYAFQRRQETGAYSVHTSGGSGTAPGWVRLVRTGDLFEAYRSPDGTAWTRIGTDTIPMGETVYVGLAVTSHNTGTATTAAVENVRITAAQTGNRAPAVSLTAPANGTQVTAPATVTLTATASDPENRMASVDFYAGTTLVSRDTTSPYSATWSASTAGTYSLTAVAHDADGGSTTSAAVTVTVATATNRPPTVTLSTGGTSFTAPATIALSASASDPEGQLSRVEFFNGTTRLATDSASPYTYSWSSVPAGTYSLRAVAYDAAGASATSATVTVTVTAATSAAPTAVAFTPSTDHATNVTSYTLKVFAAGANTSTATPVATSDLGKPAPDTTNTISVNRATFFSALATGSYVAVVTAIGPGGQTPSASIAFTR